MTNNLTKRQHLVLAALAAHRGAAFAPVQVQKMFFLIDENVAKDIGGKQFDFQPYDYGPFDKAVYHELETLAAQDLVRVDRYGPTAGQRRYSATSAGQEMGEKALAALSPRAQAFMSKASEFVRRHSFAQLVGSIYKAYPHMRTNSVFQE